MGKRRNWNAILTEKYLEENYVDKKKSAIQIAKELKCSDGVIRHHLKKHDIGIRGLSEACSLVVQRHRKIDLNATDYIDGLLLSDGHLVRLNWSTGYTQTCKFREWLKHIVNELLKSGIEGAIYKFQKGGKYYHFLWTRYYSGLNELHDRWYSNGKKHVPEDIELTPRCVANWYMGDGSLSDRAALFRQTAFEYEEMQNLSEKLNKVIGVNSHVRKNKTIYIPVKDTPKLLKYIEPFKLPCFDYKWCARKLHVSENDGRSDGS